MKLKIFYMWLYPYDICVVEFYFYFLLYVLKLEFVFPILLYCVPIDYG